MGLEERLKEDSAITISLEQAVNWARKYSVWPLLAGLACCAMEQIGAGVSRHDISQKMGPVIKRLYDQMQEPKWVIAMGICASSGGPFNNYAIVQGVDKIIPVDVYVPGCPPRPEALLYALIMLQKKIANDKFRDRVYLPATAEGSLLPAIRGGRHE
jgi:NADH-quinone oxidoreductase subunit B